MFAVIDYNAGNTYSLICALNRLGHEAILTKDRETILKADRVIFPGVGDASSAMSNLIERNLVETIREIKAPFLGICLGMQLMNLFSQEGNVNLLGLTNANVIKFRTNKGYKIPHMGWNTIKVNKIPLFQDIKDDSYVYYVHSYYVSIIEETIAKTEYAELSFSAAIKKNNFYGLQFHPEKSGITGETILNNFLTREM